MPPETTTNAPAAPSLPAGSQPSGTGSPAPQSQSPPYDVAEFGRLQRIAQRFEGKKSVIDAAQKYGFNDPKDFEGWGGFRSKAEKRGFKLDHLSKMFDDEPAPGQQAEPKYLTQEDFDRLQTERDAKLTKDFDTKRAREAHKSAVDAEYASFDKIDEILKDTPQELRDFAKAYARQQWIDKRPAYGDDNLLKGDYGPAGDKSNGEIMQAVQAHATKIRASFLAGIGDAAKKQTNTTSQPGPAGAPAKDGNKGDWVASAEQKVADGMRARQAKRAAAN